MEAETAKGPRSRASHTPPVSPDERLAFERLLADLSAKCANVPGECLEDEIENALRQLLVFLGFDRCTYGELTPDGTGQILCSAAVEGIEPFARGPLPANFGWLLDQVRAGKMIVYRDPDELPGEAVGLAEYACRIGIRSNVIIPLSVGGRIVGGIAFAAFRSTRDWPEDLIARIKLIGEVFAQAVARKRADEKLITALKEVQFLKERLEQDNKYLIEAAQIRLPLGLGSRSPRFKLVLQEIAHVAPTGTPVLLMGETGCGKEVLAQAIHDMSPRKHRPMIKINCAALPPTLIESELFGREKGAYTGALAQQKGRFEIASGSSLLLDEIGDLPLELQPKLLRVLQDGKFERVGGTRTIEVDVRIIAATNQDLTRAIGERRFREDLFYRLNVFPIIVPPLRERAEDIPLLAWTFVKEFATTMGKPIEHIAEDSMAALVAYPWPGNVRELRNVIERAMILTQGTRLHVSLGRTPIAPRPAAAIATLEEAERSHIETCLERTGWRIRGAGGAAAVLGINPTTLESRMKKLGLVRRR